MARHEARLEELIGRLVTGPGGPYGRIEDVCVTPSGDDYVVTSFVIGPIGRWAKVTAFLWQIPTLRALGLARKKGRRREIPWQWVDLSDPAHPKVDTSD